MASRMSQWAERSREVARRLMRSWVSASSLIETGLDCVGMVVLQGNTCDYP